MRCFMQRLKGEELKEYNGLINQAKQISQAKEKKKKSILVIIIWGIAMLIGMIVFLPVGIVLLGSFPAVCLWQWVSYRKMIIQIADRMKLGLSPEIPKPLNQKVERKNLKEDIQTGNRNVSSSRDSDNAVKRQVVNAGASYVIGKVATETIKTSRTYQNMAKNPNRPKSNTTVVSKNKGIAKMGSSHKNCGTCEFWEGNRQLDAVNHGRIVTIIEKSGKCNCKQSTKNKSICQYNNACSKWCKWNNML